MDKRVVKDDQIDLSSAIEQLARDAFLLEPADLPRLGGLLNRVNSINDRINEMGLAGMASITGGLKVLIEKLIMEEVSDRSLAIEAIGKGVSLLQELKENNGEWEEEVDPWKVSLASLGVSFQSVGTKEEESPAPAPLQGVGESPSDRELCQDFVVEALEHLGSIEIHLINLEQNPEDQDCISAVFRPFHNIKGVSGFLNLTQINRFAHEIETLLDRARSKHLKVTPELVDLVLSAVDQMKAMILDVNNSLETGSPLTQWDLEHHIGRIHQLQGRLRADRAQQPEPIGRILVGKGAVTSEDVEAALEKQKGHTGYKRLGEILIEVGKAKPSHVLQALREQKTQIPTSDTARGGIEAVKIDTGKLNTLVDLIEELAIVQSVIRQNSHVAAIRDQKLLKDFSHLGRVTAELQQSAMSLRMVPIGQTFQRMVRLVRDLSRKSGKGVELRMEGGDTAVDRNMVEALYDPLVHMIRNAVDHGIETPEVRKKAGKPESGCISLRAYQRGGSIVIEIGDDGRGLDFDRILCRAREKGLIGAKKRLTERQMDMLIFYPGFSTSDKVTEVSGRGVGLDVVKKAVEGLRGTVEIASKRGKGSVFTIRLPLTLAIIKS